MAETKYCMGCMQPLSWDGRCRFCDFKEEEYRQEEHDLPLRSTLKNGEYITGRVLGAGGFGITYIGMDTTLLHRVAIKEFYPGHLARRDTQNHSVTVMPSQDTQKDAFDRGMASFLQEGQILAKCSRLNAVAGVKKLFKENGTAYLVMDYVDGMSVKEYVQAFGAMDPEIVLSMMKPVICDLQRIHEEHIFHRDISADNLILDTDGKLVLIDFGSARHILPESEKTKTILYKPGYSALEQYSASGKQGSWTDVYGLCASVYYMLTGIVPDSALERISDDSMQSLCDMESITLPAEIRAALWRGMAVEPKDRCQSMAELYQALYHEQISEILPAEAGVNASPRRDIPYSVREKVLSHTRMKRELLELSRKREREIARRKWALRLAVLAVFILGTVIYLGVHNRNDQKQRVSERTDSSEISVGAVADTTVSPEAAQAVAAGGEQTGEPEEEQAGESKDGQTAKRAEKLADERKEEQVGESKEEQTGESKDSQTAEQAEKQAGGQKEEQAGESKDGQTAKRKEKQAEKPKKEQTGESKAGQATKPKEKPAEKPETPALSLQEDEHVAGDLRSVE